MYCDICKIKQFNVKKLLLRPTYTFYMYLYMSSDDTSFVQSDAANDNFSLVKFHRSRRLLAATKNRTIFSSLSSLWINLSTYKIRSVYNSVFNFQICGTFQPVFKNNFF